MSVEIASSFVEGAPPGELHEVLAGIKALTSDTEPDLVAKLTPALQNYNESQFVAAKLPGSSQSVLITPYNRLTSTTYYDPSSQQSFTFDHSTQKASSASPHTPTSTPSDPTLLKSLTEALHQHTTEHYPANTASSLVVPDGFSPSKIHIVLSSLKSSPQNFLSGRWRTHFTYDTNTQSLDGTISVAVHYYEDGNVALSTNKTYANEKVTGSGAAAIVKAIAAREKTYQEELNRALVGMNEGSFRGLRRQLPVTRQRIEWERVRGYGLSENLKGEAGGKKG